MKITKKRLKEIVREELKRGLKEVHAPGHEEFTRQAAIAGAKEAGKAGAAGLGRAASGLTPREGQIEAIIQAIHNELVNAGEIPDITTVARLVRTALEKSREAKEDPGAPPPEAPAAATTDPETQDRVAAAAEEMQARMHGPRR
jgi:hypothetical protein